MLGKLMKYEFLATGRILLPIYAALLVMSAAGGLLLSGGDTSVLGQGLSAFFVILILAVLHTAVWITTLVMVLRRFWGNLLGREGYLMHVLPVAAWEHVLCKLLCAMVWTVLSSLVTMLSVCILLGLGSALRAVEWSEMLRTWNLFRDEIRRQGSAGALTLLCVETVILVLLGIAGPILRAYTAMCVGQLANRHRVWAAIGAYLGIGIVQSAVVRQLAGGRILRFFGGSDYAVWSYRGEIQTTGLPAYLGEINRQMLIVLLVTLAFSAAMFFASQWLLRRRLNLQ